MKQILSPVRFSCPVPIYLDGILSNGISPNHSWEKVIFCVVVLLLITVTPIFAQQGKYQRKSISSVETVWIKPGALQGGVKFDYDFFDKMVDYYIEVERFDYNVLPEKLLTNYHKQADALTEITTDRICKVLENTVVTEIVNILNSPDVKRNRGLALKDEAAWQTFAATKAKSIGLTVKELEALMNSAYIYLPYISSAKQEFEKESITVTINGGILWYQVKVDKDGNTSVKKIIATTAKGRNLVAIVGSEASKKFRFGSEVFETNAAQYAQYDAVLTWVKNLAVKTKEINAFKLQAQVVEVIGRKYSFPLGFLEGVHLDDGFNLVEFEDREGNEIVKRVGFVRVIKTGKNIEDPTNYTVAVQLLGRRQDIGSVVMEHPRLGIDLQIKAGYITGINIPKEYTNFDDGIMANIHLAYNIAPIIGISQTFIDFDMGFGLCRATFNEDIMFDFYIGFIKKLWFKRVNLGISAAVGIGQFNTNRKIGKKTYHTSHTLPGFKYSADFEYLINPDLSFNFGANFKKFLNLNLVVLKFGAGINYSLHSLSTDWSGLFSLLDPFKKY